MRETRPPIRLLHLVVILLALGVPAASASTHNMLRPVPVDAESYAETFTLIADLQGGTYVQIQLAVSNIGPGDRHGVCRALVVRPGTAPWTASERVSEDEWSATQIPRPTLRVGPCRLEAGAALTVDVQLDERTLLLSLGKEPLAVTPPGHPVWPRSAANPPGDAFYESRILVPWAPAQLVMTAEDGTGDAQTLSGFGYADHSRSTTLPSELARGFLRLRRLQPGCELLVLLRFPAEADTLASGYRWAAGAAAPEPLLGFAFEGFDWADDATTPVPPRLPRLRVTNAAGGFAIAAVTALYRHAPLQELGFLGRLVGPWVGDAVTQTFRGVLIDGSACSTVEGVLELTRVRN